MPTVHDHVGSPRLFVISKVSPMRMKRAWAGLLRRTTSVVLLRQWHVRVCDPYCMKCVIARRFTWFF
jgi:hypothetical protein